MTIIGKVNILPCRHRFKWRHCHRCRHSFRSINNLIPVILTSYLEVNRHHGCHSDLPSIQLPAPQWSYYFPLSASLNISLCVYAPARTKKKKMLTLKWFPQVQYFNKIHTWCFQENTAAHEMHSVLKWHNDPSPGNVERRGQASKHRWLLLRWQNFKSTKQIPLIMNASQHTCTTAALL